MAMALASNVIPPPRGFRFRPSVKELINDFLKPKMFGSYDPQVDQFVPTIPLSNLDPWDIPRELNMPWENTKWYFFCVREKLRGKENQFKRKGKSGFWKSTCEEEEIIDGETGKCIGKKRILVFHKGRHPGQRTECVIHEYALNNPLPDQSVPFVICCLMKNEKKTGNTKKAKKAKKDVDIPTSLIDEPSGFIASDAIACENGHADNNCGYFSQPNLPCPYEGEPSGNFTSNSETPTANSALDDIDDAQDSILYTQPMYSPHNDMPYVNFYDENTYGTTLGCNFDEYSSQRTSFEMPHFPDQTPSYGFNADGVDGPVNVSGPLAPGEHLQ